MNKKITVDEWIAIATNTIETFCNCLEDDGKISLRDGLTLVLGFLKDIAKAYKNQSLIMFRHLTCSNASSGSVHISGTSLTIPGLAPDLQTLLAAAEEGEPLPQSSVPLWDESIEQGSARVAVGNLPPEDILLAVDSARPEKASHPGAKSEVSASLSEEDDKRSAKDDE